MPRRVHEAASPLTSDRTARHEQLPRANAASRATLARSIARCFVAQQLLGEAGRGSARCCEAPLAVRARACHSRSPCFFAHPPMHHRSTRRKAGLLPCARVLLALLAAFVPHGRRAPLLVVACPHYTTPLKGNT